MTPPMYHTRPTTDARRAVASASRAHVRLLSHPAKAGSSILGFEYTEHTHYDIMKYVAAYLLVRRDAMRCDAIPMMRCACPSSGRVVR